MIFNDIVKKKNMKKSKKKIKKLFNLCMEDTSLGTPSK